VVGWGRHESVDVEETSLEGREGGPRGRVVEESREERSGDGGAEERWWWAEKENEL